MNTTYKEDFTEPITVKSLQPIFDLLENYRHELTRHPLMEAARRKEAITRITDSSKTNKPLPDQRRMFVTTRPRKSIDQNGERERSES